MIDFLQSCKVGKRILIIYNEIKLIDIYDPVVEKFLDINTPMIPFESALNDKELHIVLQDLCWLLLYDMIPKEFISEELKDIHRSTKENFSMNFAQLDKKIINSTILFSGKFMELWSIIINACFFSFLLTAFPESVFSDNVPFVIQVEKYINTVLTGIPPQNMREFHKSVLGLVSNEVRYEFPTFITITEPEPQNCIKIKKKRPPSKNLIRNTDKKGAQIRVPQNNKPIPKRYSTHDKSGMPIARAHEVFKKCEGIINDYKIDRTRQLYDICAQEELYMESKEVPPITPLGITFEDFPKPHFPADYYNPNLSRKENERRCRCIRRPKNAPKRRYRVIPEPEETMETIARAHEYLTDNPVYLF